jgi:hypothetical protein
MRLHCGTTLGFDGGYYMTCSKNFGRLLQASCLGLIGMLTVVSCGGSDSKPAQTDAWIGGGVDSGTVLPVTKAHITASPTIVPFGAVGSTGSTLPVTLTNDGNAPTTIVATPSVASITSTGCTGSLTAGSSCTLMITVSPPAAATDGLNIGGTITIVASAANTLSIGISATASVPPPGMTFTVNPSSILLPDVAVGALTKATVTVTATTAFTGMTVSVQGADLKVDAATNCTGVLAANATCNVVVDFTGTAVGTPTTDAVLIQQGGFSKTIPVSVNVLAPAKLAATPTLASLPATAGSASAPLDINVGNIGGLATGALGVALAPATGGHFAITSDKCSIVTLAAGATCVVTVTYNPAATATANETATLTITDKGTGASSAVAALTGITNPVVIPGQTVLTLTGGPDLGSVAPGASGAEVIYTATNTSATASGPLTVTVVNGGGNVTISSDSCSTKATLVQGDLCTIGLKLTPPKAALPGAVAAALTVAWSTGSKSATATGAIVSNAGLSATPTAVTFGSIPVNQASQIESVTIKNTGATPTGALIASLTGSGAAQVKITSDTCSTGVLAPTKTCTIAVQYSPTDDKGVVGQILVTDGLNATISVPMSGTGLIPSVLKVTPPKLTFSGTVIGYTAAAQSLDVSLFDATALDSGDITTAITGKNLTDFAVDATLSTCTAIHQGQHCSLFVTFTPSAAGSRLATLTVSGSKGGVYTIDLSGTGLALMEIQPIASDSTVITDGTGFDFGQVQLLSATSTGNVDHFRVVVRAPNTTASHTTTVSVVLTDPSQPADFSNTPATTNPCNGAALDFAVTTAPTGWTWLVAGRDLACTFDLRFYPQSSEGKKTATLAASETVGGGKDTQTLTGVAAGLLTFGPKNPSFASDWAVGTSTNDAAGNISLLSADDVVVTLTNNSQTAPVGPIAISLTGANKDEFVIVQDKCTDTILAHASTAVPPVPATCTVALAFVPTSVGAKKVTVNAVAGTETATIDVTANATTGFGLTVLPTPGDFGSVIQTQNKWVEFTVKNPDGAPKSAQVEYDINGDSTYVLADGTAATHAFGTCGISGFTALEAGKTCTIFVGFYPTADDAVPAAGVAATVGDHLNVWATDFTPNVDVPLKGKPASQLSITPAAFSFPNTVSGHASAATTLVVANSGSQTIALHIPSNPSLAPFSVDTTTGCAANASLAAGSQCNLVVTFTGQATAGTIDQLLTISDTLHGQTTATAKLTGATVNPAKLVAVGLAQSPQPVINLGAVQKGSKTGNVTLLFQNTGSVATSALHYQWLGVAGGADDVIDTQDSQFLIVTEDPTTCVAKSSLGPNATCTLTVNFAPLSSTTLGTSPSKKLTLSADQGGLVDFFTLTATVLDPANSAWAATSTGTNAFFAFPGKTPNPLTATAPSQIFQLTKGTSTVGGTVSITGTDVGPTSNFGVDPTAGAAPCSAGVGSTGTCTFAVIFHPLSYLPTTVYRWTVLSLSVNGGAPSTLGVWGQVQSPAALTLTPALAASGQFGQIVVGNSSTKTFTVTNTGETASGTIAIAALTAGFAATGCASTKLAAAGATGDSCTFTITATPTAVSPSPDALTTQLQVNDGAVASAAQTLTATGVYNTALSLSSPTMTFPSQAVGTTSAVQVVTITNAPQALDSGVLAIALQDSTNFTILSATGANDCAGTNHAGATPPLGLTTAYPTCTVSVKFIPQTLGTGTFNSNLTFTDPNGIGTGKVKTVAITGTAISALAFTPAATTATVKTTATFTVTLDAGVAKSTPFLKTSISGSNYIITQDECVVNKLAPGDSCQISVLFVGTAATPAKTGTLTVDGGSDGLKAVLSLTSS